jgi:hypothetical protein
MRSSAAALLLALLSGAACTTDVVSLSFPEALGGFSRYVHYTCCDPLGVESCAQNILGSESSCKDVGIWKSAVSDSCAAQGLTLTEYTLHGVCGTTDDAGAAVAK